MAALSHFSLSLSSDMYIPVVSNFLKYLALHSFLFSPRKTSLSPQNINFSNTPMFSVSSCISSLYHQNDDTFYILHTIVLSSSGTFFSQMFICNYAAFFLYQPLHFSAILHRSPQPQLVPGMSLLFPFLSVWMLRRICPIAEYRIGRCGIYPTLKSS